MNSFSDCKSLDQVLGQLAGAASMCWSPRPTGEFLPDFAGRFVDDARDRIQELAANVVVHVVTREGDEYYKLSSTDEYVMGWAPISVELLTSLVEDLNDLRNNR